MFAILSPVRLLSLLVLLLVRMLLSLLLGLDLVVVRVVRMLLIGLVLSCWPLLVSGLGCGGIC